MTGRRLSFALLLATLGAHLVCVWWGRHHAGGGVAAAVRLFEASLPLAASGALAVAMFAMRRIVRVRAATIARSAAALIAIALLDGPPVFVPALLVATTPGRSSRRAQPRSAAGSPANCTTSSATR